MSSIVEEVSPIRPGVKQSLVAPLQGAVDSLNRGVASGAINQLGAFMNMASAYSINGTLTSEQATALIGSAQQIVQRLPSNN